MIFWRGLPFGQVREDPAVELAVADEVADLRRGVCIASAGCTAFSLLTRSGQWTALDINPAQLQLSKRKRNLMLHCDKAEFLRQLDLLNQSGRIDRYLARLAYLYRRWVQRPGEVEEFLRLSDPVVQRQRFRERWDNWRWRLCFGLAVSAPLLRLVYGSLVSLFPGRMASVMRRQVEDALLLYPANSNVYLWQTFLQRYPDGHLPYYVEHFEAVRERLRTLEFAEGDALDWLAAQPEHSVDFFGFSNILEVTDDRGVARLAMAIARAGRAGALVVLRRIIPRSYRPAAEPHLRYLPELSERVAALETGCFCRTIEIYQC